MTDRRKMDDPKPFFEIHTFVCVNIREDNPDNPGCGTMGAMELQGYMKDQIKAKTKNWRFRTNRAGCLGRCQQGPVMVIYPEGVWYAFKDEKDIDEIIDRHIIAGERVERLIMDRKEVAAE